MKNNLSQAIEAYKKQADMTNTLECRWISMFLQLVDFKNINGHADVPARYPLNKSLGYWIRRQRLVYTQGTMDLKREELLRIVGFNFRLLDVLDWDNMYSKLLNFKEQHGHAHITETNCDTQLYNWLKYQRVLYWQGKLDYSKIEKLKNTGVDMRHQTLNHWENMYERLVQFKEKHGHLNVTPFFGAEKELINFVKVIRRTQETKSQNRKEKLNTLGFVWSPQNTVVTEINKFKGNEQWLKRYQELKRYKEQYGTCYICTTSKTHKSLSGWISVQRNKVSKLSKFRISLLREIEFFKDNKVKEYDK